MKIKKLHTGFIMPTKGSVNAGAFDVYMPEAGSIHAFAQPFKLGFSAEVPVGHVALIFPRSSTGAKFGVELNNTCGIIDSDYRGEWVAYLRTKMGVQHAWKAGERVLQFMIVPVADVTLELVDELDTTERGSGGFGSSGK